METGIKSAGNKTIRIRTEYVCA